ncbi:hypothetical protein [Streptomyces sp. NPDC048411]|uniref:hypothetical protein n=1 Tax=Streptomyces sp. NPDC048411 TaxID=3157206 RepID=UPI003455A6A9
MINAAAPDGSRRAEAARLLFDSCRSGAPVAPLTALEAGLTMRTTSSFAKSAPRPRPGTGSRATRGITVRPMQRQLGVDEPDYGHLLDSRFRAEHTPRALDDAGAEVREVSHGDGLGSSSFNYGFSSADEMKLIAAAADEAVRARIAVLRGMSAARKT